MNKIEISGIISNEPETFYSPSGLCIMNLKIVLDKQANKENQIPVVAHGKIAEMNRGILKKETKIAVHGELQSRNYTTIDGENKTVIEVIAKEIEIIK